MVEVVDKNVVAEVLEMVQNLQIAETRVTVTVPIIKTAVEKNLMLKTVKRKEQMGRNLRVEKRNQTVPLHK